MSECRVVKSGAGEQGSIGVSYERGLSAESVGAQGICMHLGTIPPGGRAAAHKHEGHESVIYVLSGNARMEYGGQLEHHVDAEAGDFVYVPAGMPHRPYNLSDSEPARFVVARTDPKEEESVVLLPELG
jgi:uncharacterized RmlC-like cupin family protein